MLPESILERGFIRALTLNIAIEELLLIHRLTCLIENQICLRLKALQARLGEKSVLFPLRCHAMSFKVLLCLNLNAVICYFCIFLRIFVISDQDWFSRIYLLFWLIRGWNNIVRNNKLRLALIICRFRTVLFYKIDKVLPLQQGKLILNHAYLLIKTPQQGCAAHLLQTCLGSSYRLLSMLKHRLSSWCKWFCSRLNTARFIIQDSALIKTY